MWATEKNSDYSVITKKNSKFVITVIIVIDKRMICSIINLYTMAGVNSLAIFFIIILTLKFII
jgi:hypothetical protein